MNASLRRVKVSPRLQPNTAGLYKSRQTYLIRMVRPMMITRILSLGVAGVSLIVGAGAQIPISPDEAKCASQIRSTYLLGPDDQLEIFGPELSDLPNKPVRIDGEGDIQVPLVGRVHVAGLTVQQTEQELNRVLSTYIRKPQVVVGV